MRLWRRLGFRRQLMVMIAGVMALGGGLLLAVQYVVLSILLSNAITVQNEQSAAAGEVSGNSSSPTDAPVIEVARQAPAWMQSDPVVTSILGDVQIWSGILLVAFTVITILAAWFLSHRASNRIAAVTTATSAITEKDLSKRLQIPGPDDEIKLLGTAINSMVERLESAFLRQEAFIANASHEFRTPLATVRTALQVAMRQQRIPAELMPEMEDVLDANRRLEDLVAALLTIAQGRARTDLQFTSVDLHELITESLTEHSSLARQQEIACTFTAPDSPVLVDGNRPLLYSLTGNLLTNAIRHNHTGGSLTIDLITTGAQTTITVSNSGQVIAAEFVGEMTEPFQRGDRSRLRNADGSEAGSGLGLTLVESIVTLHRGKLAIEAREEGGLIVRASIPVHRVMTK